VKAFAAVFAVLLAGTGSTCQRPQGGAEGAAKDAPPTAASAADVTLPGLDTSVLTPRERREWSGYVSEFLAPCADVPVSVAQCVAEKRACPRCAPAAKFLFKAVRDGMSREQVETLYKNRFAADRIKQVPIENSPIRGPEGAAITIVEFADFECPYCAVTAPRLEKAIEANPKQVRLVYKFMPLQAHVHGEPAARAAIAAGEQKKFWEMHKKLFENQKRLEQADLEGYAKDLGLDLARFRADMQAPGTTERLARDRKLADSLGVKGTPTIYINGREFDPQQDLGEWIAVELGGAGPAAAAATGSAAGPAGGAPPPGAAAPSAAAPSAAAPSAAKR